MMSAGGNGEFETAATREEPVSRSAVKDKPMIAPEIKNRMNTEGPG